MNVGLQYGFPCADFRGTYKCSTTLRADLLLLLLVLVLLLLLLLLLLLFIAVEFSLGGSSPYNSNK